MTAGTQDINVESEASFRMTATYNGPSYPALGNYAGGYAGGYYGVSGAPQDLTGCTAKMQVRRRSGLLPQGDPYFTLTDTDGLTLGGPEGTIQIYISGDRTALLPSKTCAYDLYLTFPSGDRVRVLEGAVNVDPTVTVF